MATVLTLLGLLLLAVAIFGLLGVWWALVFLGLVLVAGGVLTHLATPAAPAEEESTP